MIHYSFMIPATANIIIYHVGYFTHLATQFKQLELLLYPPLSFFDHLVSQVETTLLAPSPLYFRIRLTRIDLYIDVYIKASFGAKMYLHVL